MLAAILPYLKSIAILVLMAALTREGRCFVRVLDGKSYQTLASDYQHYLLHVHLEASAASQVFKVYCQGKDTCFDVGPDSQMYTNVTNFIKKPGEYLAILDWSRQKKYVLMIANQQLTTSQIAIFQRQFNYDELEAYYSSEKIPTETNQKCQKIVGLTYEQFLKTEEPIKMVLLMGGAEHCEVCSSVLKVFQGLSEQLYQKGVISFGYIDLVENDHRYIKDQIMPYFLLYIGDNFEDPYGIGPDELDMLPQYLAQVIKDTEKLWNNQRVPSREPPASSMLHDL